MLEMSFNVCKLVAYSNTRRGIPADRRGRAGRKCKLKKMKNVQKCHLDSLRFRVFPVILGNQ